MTHGLKGRKLGSVDARHVGSRPTASARLDIEVWWASPSSRVGLCRRGATYHDAARDDAGDVDAPHGELGGGGQRHRELVVELRPELRVVELVDVQLHERHVRAHLQCDALGGSQSGFRGPLKTQKGVSIGSAPPPRPGSGPGAAAGERREAGREEEVAMAVEVGSGAAQTHPTITSDAG